MFNKMSATTAWAIVLIASIPASLIMITTIEKLPLIAMATMIAYGILFISATMSNKTQTSRIAHNRKMFVRIEALKAGVSYEYAKEKFDARF